MCGALEWPLPDNGAPLRHTRHTLHAVPTHLHIPPSPNPHHTPVVWAAEHLRLLPDPALWWPAQATVFIADLHLGKAASFRALGQPVPGGTTRDNLQRLDALIAATGAHHLVCLGDFLHAASARTPAVLQALADWRARHPTLRITLVRGNHDDHAGDPPPETQIAVVDEPWSLGPFACCHHPQTQPNAFVLAGHLHPVHTLRGPGRDRLRLPCFVADAAGAVLPAFGAFTGGHRVTPQAGQRVYLVGDQRVWPLP